jgi:protein-tyrosine-phosphatase
MAHAIFVAELARPGLDCDVQSAGVIDMNGALAAANVQKVCVLWGTPSPKLESVYIAALELTNVTRVFVMEPSHRERVCAMMQVDTQRVQLIREFDPQRRGPAIEDRRPRQETKFEQYLTCGGCALTSPAPS